MALGATQGNVGPKRTVSGGDIPETGARGEISSTL